MTPKKRKTRRWELAFLAALKVTGLVSRAAAAARVPRQVAYRYRASCPEFADEWEQAIQEAADALQDEAFRRARDGTPRFKFKPNGDPVLHPVTGEPYFEMEYSDTLLIFLLKGLVPENWGPFAKEIRELKRELENLKAHLKTVNPGL